MWRCGALLPSSELKEKPKKQGMHHIIDGAEDALDFTILRRGVWTRHP
jgi:hypothetical protein